VPALPTFGDPIGEPVVDALVPGVPVCGMPVAGPRGPVPVEADDEDDPDAPIELVLLALLRPALRHGDVATPVAVLLVPTPVDTPGAVLPRLGVAVPSPGVVFPMPGVAEPVAGAVDPKAGAADPGVAPGLPVVWASERPAKAARASAAAWRTGRSCMASPFLRVVATGDCLAHATVRG
jgi:hypothetical protein